MKDLQTSLLDRITDGFVALDKDWRFVFVNHQAAEILGIGLFELLGQNIWETFPALLDTPFFQVCQQAIGAQEPRQLDRYSTRLDRWLENRLYPAPDGLTIFFTDITARKQAEAALQATALRLETLLASLQAGVIVEDERGQVVLTNQTFRDMMDFSLPAEALVGANVIPMARNTALLFADGESFMARALELRRRQRSVQAEELDLTDGRVWERDYVPVFPGGSGDEGGGDEGGGEEGGGDEGGGEEGSGREEKYGGHLWLFRDVTERKRIEQQHKDDGLLLGLQKAELENANRELAAVNDQLAGANTRLEALATRDDLTALLNHRVFSERLREEWRRARRYQEPLSLIMIDVDRFKAFNDAFGHVQGNRVLPQLASVLGEHVRETDILARFGGEEFVVILPHTDCAEAVPIAERLRAAVEAYAWDLRPITISLGVCELSEGMADAAALIHGADMAMYRSKSEGRNRVSECLADASPGKAGAWMLTV